MECECQCRDHVNGQAICLVLCLGKGTYMYVSMPSKIERRRAFGTEDLGTGRAWRVDWEE
jgi:hypothetical protein